MEEFYSILWSVVGIVATGLATWGMTVLTKWLSSKIKDKDLAKIATSCTTLIFTVVRETFQTYVEALKKAGKFDEAAQKEAKEKAMSKLKSELTSEQIEYIKSISTDVEAWLSDQIEAAIYQLKKE